MNRDNLHPIISCVLATALLAVAFDNAYTNYQLRVRLDTLEEDRKALSRAEARATFVSQHLRTMLERDDWKNQNDIP